VALEPPCHGASARRPLGSAGVWLAGERLLRLPRCNGDAQTNEDWRGELPEEVPF
jgi:hypothetical protein